MKTCVTYMRLAFIIDSVHCEVQIRPRKQVTPKKSTFMTSVQKKNTSSFKGNVLR